MHEQTNEPSSALEPATRRQAHVAIRGCSIGLTLTRRISSATKRVRRIASLQFVFLAFVFCAIQSRGTDDPLPSDSEASPRQVDSYTREQNQRVAAERQELFRIRVAIPEAVSENVPPANPPPSPTPTVAAQTDAVAGSNTFLMGTGVFFLGIILTLRVLAPKILNRINRRLNPWMLLPEAVTARPTRVRAEEEAFAKFVAAFKVGPSNSAVTNPAPTPVVANAEPAVQNGEADVALEIGVEDFHAAAQERIVTQRKLLEDVNQASDDAARQRAVAALCSEVHAFKTEASRPELQVVWQVASTLEGLLRQLADKAKNVTPSTLRTVAGAVELLADMSVPELNPGLLRDYPLHFLAVDNDLISGKALIVALKKALTEPHLAMNSDAACALAGRHAYDVIFLDAQMPGVDGFELCTRIHETTLNRVTPVVFVTRQSDFDTWAKSALSDGSDLMAKPFLTFEVILKALTLALRRRLQGGLPEGVVCSDFDGAAFAPAAAHANSGNGAVSADSTVHEIDVDADDEVFDASSDLDDTESFEHTSSEVDVFLDRAAQQLEPLRGLFESMLQTAEEEERKELLAEAYVRIRTFAPRTNRNAAHPAMRVSTALQGLFRKLLEDPARANPSTLVTAAFAVDLLSDLCVAGLSPDLITDPPIRMLVVDDNAGSRRTLTNALQMAFEQPDSADDGEAALALAAEKRYDVIFLDVQMPGMDGFAVCSGIRETELNQTTPVVYVTGQDNVSTRSRMSLSGGSDFVSKPFLTSEVTVKALTFALRGRLQQLELAPA